MNDEFKNYKLIEQYLAETLKDEALDDFNSRLNNDAELRKEVALQQDIEIGLTKIEDIPFIKSLNEIHKKETIEPLIPAESTQPNTIIRYLKIAGAVAAVLIGGIFISQLLSQSPTPLALSEKMIGEPLEQNAIRSQANRNERLGDAYNEIENKNYKTAIHILSDLYENKMNLLESGLALGYAYMQNKQYEKAIETFNQLLKFDTENEDKINWYLAHTYLRNKQPDESINVLDNMLESPIVTNKRKRKVKKMINQVNKHF